jgi:parallel beta-helix repeat protein
VLNRTIPLLLAAAASLAGKQFDVLALGAACDGRTDDSARVQAAVDRLRPGDILLVPCRAGIGRAGLALRDRRNVTIRGTDGGGFKALAPAGLASQGFSPVMMLVQNCADCVVESLYFEMNRLPQAAIGLDRCDRTTLRGNTVADTGYPANAAIVATANRQNSYLSNRVLRTGSDSQDGARGMWIGNGNDSREEFQPTVSQNQVEAAGATGIVVHARGAVVSNNTVARSKGAGIKLIVRAPQARVAGNFLTANAFHGLQFELAESVRVERNTFDGNGISGVYVSGGAFSGEVVENVFYGNREAGIYLYEASGVRIRDNRFAGGQAHGVLLEAIEGGSIQGVDISGNAIWDQSADGIAVRARGGALSGLRIEGNSFGGRTPAGVRIEDRAERTAGRIELGPNCFDRQLSRTLYDQRRAALPAPAPSTCAQPASKKEGRPE